MTNQWSCLSASSNSVSSNYLLEKALHFPEWSTPILGQDSLPTIEISRTRAITYLETSRRWLKTLLALCYMTSGAPARGTEINQVIWHNTQINPRNLFLDPVNHVFLIRLAYSKTFSRNHHEKNAVRALPQSLSYLLLGYLVYIRPFEECLLISLYNRQPKADFLLFRDYRTEQPFSSQVLSRTLKSLTTGLLTQRINIRTWRHIVQGFIRHGLGLSDILGDLETDEFDDESLGADQMNHSRATGLAIYGRSVASFQGIRADIQTALISFSQRWHSYIGLSPDQLVLTSLFWDRALLVPTTELKPGLSQPSTPIALPMTRPLVYFCYPLRAGATAPTSRVSLGQFNEFMSLAGVDIAIADNPSSSPSDSSDLDTRPAYLAHSHLVPSQTDPGLGLLTCVLQEFLNDKDASFRSAEQQRAFYLMMKRIPYFFLILPTAAGKTTLFLLGASLFPDQITLIVIPLISLKLDLYNKAKTLGLQPTVWEPYMGYRELPTESRVILIQIEYVVHPKFYEMAEYLINQKRLSRVIWDECHLIPLSQSYRPIMRRAWHALALNAPMVFASATLPSHLQEELIEMLQLPKHLCITYRATNILKNMSYRVQALPAQFTESAYPGYLMQFIKEFEAAYKPFGQQDRARVIIFCRSKALVDSLFDALQPYAARFHADLADNDKHSQLACFRDQTRLLLATSGIGAGYDFSDVNLVIHFMPGTYEMTNFIQESGRAGRSSNQLSWSYCLVRPWQLQLSTIQKEVPLEQKQFTQYLLDQICRRRAISRIYDGEALESCDPSWNQCDLCANRLEKTLAVKIGIRQQNQRNSESLDFFERAVRYWTNERCFICFMLWDG